MHLVDPGQRVVLIADVYGGVYRMTSQIYEPKGYRFTYVPADEFDEGLASHLDEDVRMVWVETPSNPLLNVVDIRRAAEAAHAVGAILAVDNTFATPYLQQPLELGADVVVHSTTKYLGGHSDVIGGFVATNDDALARAAALPAEVARRRARPVRRVARAARDQDARRPHAPALRERARDRGSFLDGHPAVERVLYPGLTSHPGHEVALRQMRDFGGMVSFLAESEEEAVALVARTKLFLLAESLGGVESLIEHPARMTHASTADAPFAAPRNLVRLSVGIEAIGDLLADLEAALVKPAARVAPSSRLGLARLAVGAGAAQDDVVRDDVVAGLLLDRLDRALERGVVERLDLAAVVADEVMVMLVPGAHRLVAGDAVAEVDALEQALLDEAVDGAVDAREADRRAARGERLVDLLGAAAALLLVEVLDHRRPRRAHALARALQARVRLVRPARHVSMITVLDKAR